MDSLIYALAHKSIPTTPMVLYRISASVINDPKIDYVSELQYEDSDVAFLRAKPSLFVRNK